MLFCVPWLQFSKLQEKVETAESRVSVLETMIDDLQWDIDKIRKREQRLNRHLADVLERVSTGPLWGVGAGIVLNWVKLGNTFIAERERGATLFLWHTEFVL